MINSKLFINLEDHIDLSEFDDLKPEICRGIATAKSIAIDGLHEVPEGSIRPHAQGIDINPIWDVVKMWNSLPDDDPYKIAGKDLNYNQLTDFLKSAFGAYDFYRVYPIIEEVNVLGQCSTHFPRLVKWVQSFIDKGIFTKLWSLNLISVDAGGIPWEHIDPNTSDEPKDFVREFIHVKTDTDRPFYIIDPNTNERVFMNTRVAYWNESIWHGGLPVQKPTYTLRINGTFTDDFKLCAAGAGKQDGAAYIEVPTDVIKDVVTT